MTDSSAASADSDADAAEATEPAIATPPPDDDGIATPHQAGAHAPPPPPPMPPAPPVASGAAATGYTTVERSADHQLGAEPHRELYRLATEVRFASCKRGYDPAQVHAFLVDVARLAAKARGALAAKEEALTAAEARASTEPLDLAPRVDAVVRTASTKADEILVAARDQAVQLVAEARSVAEYVHSERLDALRREADSVDAQVTAKRSALDELSAQHRAVLTNMRSFRGHLDGLLAGLDPDPDGPGGGGLRSFDGLDDVVPARPIALVPDPRGRVAPRAPQTDDGTSDQTPSDTSATADAFFTQPDPDRADEHRWLTGS